MSSGRVVLRNGPLRPRPCLAALVVGALAVVATACGGSDHASNLMRSTLAGSIDPNGDYAEIRGRVQDAAARCMHRAGFEFDAAAALPSDVASGTEALPEIVGAGPSARYAQSPSPPSDASDGEQTPTESPDEVRALLGPDNARRVTVQLPQFGEFGTGTEGCLADAYREVIGPKLALKWQTTEFIVRNLAAPLVASAREDPAVRSSTRRWRTCMTAAGDDVASPAIAFAESATNAGIAADDLACRGSSKLTSVWQHALDRAARDVDGDLEPYLVFWRETNAAIVARSR